MSDEEQEVDPLGTQRAEPADDPATAETRAAPGAPPSEASPVSGQRKRLRLMGRSRWLIAAVAAAVLALGAAGAAAAFDEFGGGHGRFSERSDEGSDGSDASCDGGKRSGEDDDESAACVATATASGASNANNANGPVVLEPTTPGGDRTVVWPDGRIVTIPLRPSSTTTTTRAP